MFIVFGRPFVKRFSLCYRTVACPVCDVGVLWPNGWMDQDATWYKCMPRPKPHCVRWRPSSSHKKGHSPQFSAHVCCGQTAGWIKMPLGMQVGLSPSHIVLDGDPSPPKGAQQPSPPTFRPMSIVAKRLDGSGYHLVRR